MAPKAQPLPWFEYQNAYFYQRFSLNSSLPASAVKINLREPVASPEFISDMPISDLYCCF